MASASDLSSISDTYYNGLEQHDENGGNDDRDDDDELFFGRNEEAALLLQTFQRISQTKSAASTPVVVVHGESGMGKTSLVDTLRIPVLNKGGFFCAGKFFQNSQLQEPYSAIMAAFSDICDVVTQSEHFTEQRRSEIQQALGSDGYLLTKAISNIAPLLPKKQHAASGDLRKNDDAIDLLMTDKSLSKFKVACKSFVRAMSSEDHPLVIFLDDIQWMDSASRLLIEMFINNDDEELLNNVLLILAYRDEEVEKVIPVLRQSSTDFVDIQLKSLTNRAIYDLVCTVTGESSPKIEELSDLVAKRSHGNPFHARAFLEMIESEGLIVYDYETSSWNFQVDQIQSSVMMKSDLAETLARKIEFVDANIKDTLKIASVLGYSFSETLLAKVALSVTTTKQEEPRGKHHRSISVAEGLSQAVEMGFVERTRSGYQFSHDQIQTAFQQLIRNRDEAESIHDTTGRAIIALGGRDNDPTMYRAAVHLNFAANRIVLDKDRHRLMEINLRAAKHCISQSAFAAARDFLQIGLGLNPSHCRWSDYYFDLTFEMTELLAKAELVLGNFDGCKEATSDALQHAKTEEMKINSFVLEVDVRMYEFVDLIPFAIRALHAVGVEMPRRVTKRHVVTKFIHIKKLMRKKTDAEILALPVNNDRLACTASKLLITVCAYSLVRDERDRATFASLQAMELLLKHGLSEGSSMSLVIYAIVEMAVGNREDACRYAKLGLRLCQGAGQEKGVACLTASYAMTLITWRKDSLTSLREKLLSSSEIAFEDGAILGATFASAQAFMFEFVAGKSLDSLEYSLQQLWDRVDGFRQDTMLLWVKPTYQCVLNLQRHYRNWKDVWVLTGDAMNEEQFALDVEKTKYTTLRGIALSLKFALACYFRYFKEAIKLNEEAERTGKAVRLSYGRLSLLYGLAFAHLELYRESGKRRHLTKARKSRKSLEKLASEGSPDAVTLLIFISAVEMMALKTKFGTTTREIMDATDSAISQLAKRGNYRLEGMLNEHAGFDFARSGHLAEARVYFDQALEVYQNKWCSSAKHQWLLEQSARYSTRMHEVNAPNMQIGSVIVCN